MTHRLPPDPAHEYDEEDVETILDQIARLIQANQPAAVEPIPGKRVDLWLIPGTGLYVRKLPPRVSERLYRRLNQAGLVPMWRPDPGGVEEEQVLFVVVG